MVYLTQELAFLKDNPSQIRLNTGAKWFEALSAAKAGLRRRTKVRAKSKKRTCYVTSELFDIQALGGERCLIQLKRDATKKTRGQYIACVVMPFAKEDAGKALYLSRKGARFWLSMCHYKTIDVEDENQLKARLLTMTDAQLSAVTTGYDLGVKRQVTCSDGSVYHLSRQAQDAYAHWTRKRPATRATMPVSLDPMITRRAPLSASALRANVSS